MGGATSYYHYTSKEGYDSISGSGILNGSYTGFYYSTPNGPSGEVAQLGDGVYFTTMSPSGKQ